MTQYQAPGKPELVLDDETVEDLHALAHLIRAGTEVAAARAVEMLRNTLVPSTREAPARAVRKGKGATA